MATKQPPSPGPKEPEDAPRQPSGEVELLKVVVARDGRQVSAQWGIHPQMKKDLLPEEWSEINALMSKVTGLVGHRFAEILAEGEPDRSGHA